MLNEPGGVANPSDPPPRAADLRSVLRAAVANVFDIQFEFDTLPAPVTATYVGRLRIDSHRAYQQLALDFGNSAHIPVFRAEGGLHVIRAVRAYAKPKPRSPWLNVVLFVATLLSVLYTGATIELGRLELPSPLDMLRGWPYALGLMLILGTHELGHYFAARHHRVAVSLPYFIPLPIGGSLGTLGAFIQLREPMRDRRALLDVGAAGPLVGLLVTIPVLVVGLATSPVKPVPYLNMFRLKPGPVIYAVEGNSLLYAGLKRVIFGRSLPNAIEDVYINQLAQAGWTGLLVTALNLIPLGQLDGGHTLYALLGEGARALFMPLVIGLALLSVFYTAWLLWLFLILFMGRAYAAPLDMITALDPRRRFIALLTLVVFVVVFIPIPVYGVGIG